MPTTLLNADRLFHTLFQEITPEGGEVAGALDPTSSESLPFITHSSQISRDANGPDLWDVTLSVNVFVEALTAFETTQELYQGMTPWWEVPGQGYIPGFAGVEELTQELSAFSRLVGQVQMNNKLVVQYVGSWQLLVRTY